MLLLSFDSQRVHAACCGAILHFNMASLTFIIQALLARHEAYVSDAEQDRKRILSKMEELEQDKRHLENRNMETVEENRKLLDQLEALNLAVDNSDTQVHSLTEKLHAAEQHLERINGLATRSEGLQRQLSRLEEEEGRLHANLDTTKENERAAVLRWQQAERTIVSLHLQIEQLEHEAKKEHDRVEEEILAGRKHALAVELQQPGQLDPTSSAKTLPQVKSGNNVISHFVKDILTDNANLQLSIVELRGLLQKSNEQVEQLRDQLTQHAPPDPSPHSPTPTLGVELGVGTKEFHVHHHYHTPLHAAESSKTPKSQIRRRTRNTRVRHASGQFTPISITSSLRSSTSQLRPSSPTPAGTILSPSAITIPRQKARWSLQSNQTGFTSSSSLPSSPSGGSIFDRAFNDTAATTDISRPTSPESASGFSPRGTTASYFDLMDRKRRQSSQRANHIDLANPSAKEDGRHQSSGTPTSKAIPLSSKRNSALGHLDIASPRHSTILEETEDAGRILTLDTDHHDFLASPSEYSSEPQLKRVASHESIFSVSGMDIHTIANRPTQRLISNRVISAPILNSSTLTSTALSDASATAVRPSLYRKRTAANSDSFSRAYLSGVAASHITNQPVVARGRVYLMDVELKKPKAKEPLKR